VLSLKSSAVRPSKNTPFWMSSGSIRRPASPVR